MQIKVKVLGQRKNLLYRLSRRAPLASFMTFYCGLKLMDELQRIWKGYTFWRLCSLLDDQHSRAGVLGRTRYLSWFAQFCKELSMAEKA